MQISIIVAMDVNRGIGFRGGIPWYLSNDLRRFRELTTGHHILFGRKTHESIGQSLPKRKIIILTRNPNYFSADVVYITDDLMDAILYARENHEDEFFIGGGAQIYQESLELVDRIYLTYVHTSSKSDVYFPQLRLDQWQTVHVEHVSKDEKNDFASTFFILDKKEII